MLSFPRALTFALAGFVALAPQALAKEWPDRPVRLIVPYAAGGVADLVGRTFAESVAPSLGQPWVVENRTGAGGMVGTDATARSAPDGYTLMVSGFPSHIGSPGINPNVTFDAIKDFTHIAFLGGPANILVAHSSLGVKNFAEFVDKTKAMPGGIEYASAGLGTTGNVTVEYFKVKSGMELRHLAYRGGSAALSDLVAGHVKVGIISVPTAVSHVRSGALVPLVISTAERSPDLPDVPTFKEVGYPDIVATTWFSLSGPAGLPSEVVAKANSAVIESIRSERLKQFLKRERIDVAPMTPAEITKFIQMEREKWQPAFSSIKKSR